ncbi:DNA-processing protein DprA [Clostridioides difficile]|uniref:DNA-processing protein DprA n=1 Tax=Clostridioides difficile TaxID=1496 RepID=UPI001179FB6F|nr:DNA-processing protein DprA [Clostridioides difficile]EGT5422254.1 DNA-protecting protein DprA [Clostridioides difficile]MBH7490209.1 DNA-protecting protein DprA [Clostridioides difficile]MBY1672810.1 DNA-processing protein DprA [Clostridioides difficile]MBY1795302.1 DNA-processing protein DprA [Clostridioides difficile]MBY1998170.1 DNA-processing protein DprA [Clostridioides difficile]
MELYIIALKELGLNNNDLTLLLSNLTLSDFINLFRGNYIETQLKYNINLEKYSKRLSDIYMLENSLIKAKKILRLNKEYKIKTILINDVKYPKRLKEIKNAPVILYYRGKGFFKKHDKSIACVGTRNPSEFSYTAIDSLIPKLVEEEFTIISGLAEGVDCYSQKICLENNGTTIAVLAHGLDMIYPKINENIALDILKNKGLLISEYPVGVKPDKFRFVDRNRIISGLSKSVIVFETKEKSGTMHTVNYAIEQKRNIFCPHPTVSTPLTTQLQNLINSKIATPLIKRSSYDIIVYNSGYKIRKDKNSANKYKSNLISSMFQNMKINNNIIFNYLNRKKDKNKEEKKISFSIDKEIHSKLSEYIKTNNLTKKELFNAFIIALLEEENKE